MPQMLGYMGNVKEKRIIDLGCGEGSYSRELNHDSGIGRQGTGIDCEVVVKYYFEPREWEAPLYQGTIPVIWKHRAIEDYVKTFVKAGLAIVDLNEPRASDEQAKISVPMAWLQKIPLYLYWELKKL